MIITNAVRAAGKSENQLYDGEPLTKWAQDSSMPAPRDEIDEGAEAGAEGLSMEPHIGLVRQAITLFRVTADT